MEEPGVIQKRKGQQKVKKWIVLMMGKCPKRIVMEAIIRMGLTGSGGQAYIRLLPNDLKPSFSIYFK